jgi:hypothetical protein
MLEPMVEESNTNELDSDLPRPNGSIVESSLPSECNGRNGSRVAQSKANAELPNRPKPNAKELNPIWAKDCRNTSRSGLLNSDDENDKSVHPVPKRNDKKSVLLKAWAKIEEPSDVTSRSGVERSTLHMPNRDTTLSVYAKDLEDENGSRRRWSNAETGDSILESPNSDAAGPRRPEERINSRKPRS